MNRIIAIYLISLIHFKYYFYLPLIIFSYYGPKFKNRIFLKSIFFPQNTKNNFAICPIIVI